MLKTLLFILALTTAHVAYSETRIVDGDPEPKDPGEVGKATLLGIDSDNDGVRDDVEIYINKTFQDLPGVDNYNYRMAFKQYTKSKLLVLKYPNDGAKVREATFDSLDAIDCLEFLYISKSKSTRAKLDMLDVISARIDNLEASIFNTSQRIKQELKTRKFLHGQSMKGSKKTSNGCYFPEKKSLPNI